MKKYLKKWIAGVLIMIFALSTVVTAYAAAPETTEDYDEVIAIVHTNDVHGHIDVEPYVKGLADEMKASGDYSLVLTVSGGDVYAGGNAVADYYKGELIPQIQDQIYDVIVPGNNDFPTGVAGNVLLTSLYKNTKTICANIQVKADTDVAAFAATYEPKIGAEDFAAFYDGVSLNEDGTLDYSALNLGVIAANTSPWDATCIVETSKGTKLGLFGLTCTSGQAGTFANTQGTVKASQECVASLKEDGADVIVGIGHVGWTGEGSLAPADGNDSNSWEVASEVQEMDAFIDAHTHSVIGDGAGCYVGDNKVLVNQAACYGDCIGVMYLYLKEGKVVDKKAQLLRGDDLNVITPDAGIQAMVDADLARLREVAGDPVARTPYFLNCERLSAKDPGGSIRGNETNLGDFVTDLILLAYGEKLGEDFAFTFMPGFWIRSSVNEGSDITKLELISVIGYDNTRLRRQTYTAADILKLVTDGLAVVAPQKDGITFNQYSGLYITYTNNEGTGTPVTIKVGDTLIYDAYHGGIQVADDWRVKGIRTLHMDGASVPEDDPDIICKDGPELREVFYNYLATHEIGKDYTIYPDTVAPAGRIVEVADYSAVYAALDKAEELDRGLYTEESLTALDEAMEGVVEDLDGSHQEEVDAMAAALEEALAALKLTKLPYNGDKVFFVKSSLSDDDAFGMWSAQKGSYWKVEGDQVIIHIIPSNTKKTYSWMHWGAITDELTKDVTLSEDGSIDLTLSTDYCGYAHPIAPIKTKDDTASASAQYYLAIPTKDKLVVGMMDEIQKQIEELQKQIEELESQLTIEKGWNQGEDGSWVYYDENYHQVKGWLKDGGKWYFLDKETGIMATGWVKDGDTWYYMNGSGAMQTGWVKVGTTWYYLKASGAMAASEWCEGYWLNANGSWTYQPKGSWKQNSTGWWFGDTSGWYAKSTTQKIDNVDYTFNAAGYWVK